jgi:deoxyribodipyrimidine photo-lyase
MLYKKSLFIFRRDLRLDDNTGLRAALKQSDLVIPCFIFDPRQVGAKNAYRSANAIQFMIESLEDLDAQLHEKKAKLYLFHGEAEKIITQLITKEKIDAVFINQDYTPFSIKRDNAINKVCHQHNVAFHASHDALINPPESIMTGNGTPYAVFTAFWKKSRQIPVEKPIKLKQTNFYTKSISSSSLHKLLEKEILPTRNKLIASHGGRDQALKILNKIPKFTQYASTHDTPSIPTTHLSAHLKFGTISVRETHSAIAKKLGASHPLIRQFYWRDFFSYVSYHSPFVFGHAYHAKYDNLKWNYSEKEFQAWCEGKTGFPIVDAGMRELNATGFMHNRVRMIVASFLTKDLHIDWRWGEKYFATQLIDYDPAVNNGNWQWAASTGCDAQPYFRIFNPWMQQKKFDPACTYIKTWVPELAHVDNKIIHNWFKDDAIIKGYSKPIIDHATESRAAKEMYRKAK